MCLVVGEILNVMLGLPASVGAVFVSRLSTDLHAHEHHPTSRSSEGSGGVENSMLTGATLFSVGLPVLLMYLIFMYSTGWLELPFIFLVMFVLAFGITVSVLVVVACARQKNAEHVSFLPVRDLPPPRQMAYAQALATWLRSRYILPSRSFFHHGACRTVSACRGVCLCIHVGSRRTDKLGMNNDTYLFADGVNTSVPGASNPSLCLSE